MKYEKIYFDIVKRAKQRKKCPVQICEKHHVVPKSFIKNNFTVILTLREHFLCHALIYKFCLKRYGKSNTRTQKALRAFFFMSNRLNIKKSSVYETLRTEYSACIKAKRKKDRIFYHWQHGKFIGTIKELVQTYTDLNFSSLYMVFNGQRIHHKGWTISYELSKKVAFSEHKNKKIYEFIHEDFGIYRGSISNMKLKYKEQNLRENYLYAVSNGSRNHHRGWERIDCVNRPLNRILWKHSSYGEISATTTELWRKYPELSLNRAHLSSVKNKKLKSHKGWELSP